MMSMNPTDRNLLIRDLDVIHQATKKFVNDYPDRREGHIFGCLVDALNAQSQALDGLRRKLKVEKGEWLDG